MQDDFLRVFAYNNKDNTEIVFSIRNAKDGCSMWGDRFRRNLVPQQAYITAIYCNKEGISFKDLPEGQLNGSIRLQTRYDLYNKAFCDGDTHKDASITTVYQKQEGGTIKYIAPSCNKYQGILLDGTSQRSFLDDYPIYRYADCLLLLAEAKVLLEEDPAIGISQVRKRTYGKEFSELNKATLSYSNDKGDFYTDSKHISGDENPLEAILKERMRKFMFKGKCWYDLGLLDADYITKCASTVAARLLWPINESVLTDNSALK